MDSPFAPTGRQLRRATWSAGGLRRADRTRLPGASEEVPASCRPRKTFSPGPRGKSGDKRSEPRSAVWKMSARFGPPARSRRLSMSRLASQFGRGFTCKSFYLSQLEKMKSLVHKGMNSALLQAQHVVSRNSEYCFVGILQTMSGLYDCQTSTGTNRLRNSAASRPRTYRLGCLSAQCSLDLIAADTWI